MARPYSTSYPHNAQIHHELPIKRVPNTGDELIVIAIFGSVFEYEVIIL